MNVQRTLAVLVLNLVAMATSHAAGDATKGQALSGACKACHGQNGLSNNDAYPNLAGQKQAYLAKALQLYQAGQRSDLSMQAVAGPLSAQDIENLAAYYANNDVLPRFSYDSTILHIPVVNVLAERYQADMRLLSDSTFSLITIKPLSH